MAMKGILTAILLSICLLSPAQEKFKEGYIVNNRHEKIPCLIRNSGDEESTQYFEYRLMGSKTTQRIELSTVEEFGIEGEFKCIRALISIDMSPDRIKSIKDTVPQWEKGHAFLHVLFEGELASLYSYNDHGTPLFFFSLEDSDIVPLVYKRYQVETSPNIIQQILYNNMFRDQLDFYLACNGKKSTDRIGYSKKQLVRYFEEFHKCRNSSYTLYRSAQTRKGILLLKPGIGVGSMALDIQNTIDAAPKIRFDKESSIGFGIGAEYIFPFNRYKWAFFAEANYLTYKTGNITVGNEKNPPMYSGYAIDYRSVELPVGINYYMNLDRNNRLFVKAAFVPYIIRSGSHIDFSDSYREEFSASSHTMFGIGYNYRSLGMEFDYYTPTNVTQNIYRRSSNLVRIALKASYAFQLFSDRGKR